MASNLGHLQVKLIDYYATKGRWPEQLGELKLSDFQLTDRVSRKPLLYFPDATHDTTDILVAQPEPFRMGLWPFGEMRRHVMLARSMDAHRILYGEDAIVLKKAGLHAPR